MANACPDKDKPKVFPPRGTRIRTIYQEMTDEEREMLKQDLGF